MKKIGVGDIFTDTWGWEQTNVDCYQVVAYKGETMVSLRKIDKKQVKKCGDMCGQYIPVKDKFISADVINKRVGKDHTLKMDYGRAIQWDGEEFYVSWYA